MKIGTFVPQGWRMDLNNLSQQESWKTILDIAKKIEDYGYESIWVYDHFHTVPSPSLQPTYECWTLMSALSQKTKKIRLGQMCTCNSYRNPSYLTKVASNIDVMSNGRLEFAIGAGWYDQEYKAYGYEYPSDGERLKMLEEAILIYIEMTTKDKASFDGKYYQILNAINEPKPIQKPYPPLWVCGGGEKVTLKLLAKYGTYGNWDVDHKGFENKSKILLQHCEDQERDYKTITRTLHTNVIIGENQNDLKEKINKISKDTDIPTDYFYKRPLVGTKDEVFESLDKFEQLGCRYLIAYVADIVWGNTLDILQERL
tara:strand:+ start:1155 stop:2096 length:942 start_codon:yes stop_codon:yes gene_type:complete